MAEQATRGYLLPAIIDPDRVCVQLYIPNERQHIAAFWGTLNRLTRWYSWMRDSDHTAKQVARVWLDVLSDPQIGCSMDIYRINPTNGCVIQVSHDDGATWSTFLDVGACIPPPPDLSHFLVRNPNSIRNNGVIPADGQFGLLVATDQNTAIGANQSGEFPALDLYTGAPSGRITPLVQLGQSGLIRVPFVQLNRGGEYHTAIGHDFMYRAPQPSFAPSPSAETMGGIYITTDGVARIIRPNGSGGYFAQLIGSGTGTGDGTLTDVTAGYTPGAPGSTPTLVASGLGATRNIQGTFPPIPDHITFDVDFASVGYGVDPSLTLMDSTASGERTIDIRLNAKAVPEPIDPYANFKVPIVGTRHYSVEIDGIGTILPFQIPSGYIISNVTTHGYWTAIAFALAFNTTFIGNGTPISGATAHQNELWANRTQGVRGVTTPGAYEEVVDAEFYFPDGFAAPEDCFLRLYSSNPTGAYFTVGHLLVDFDLTAPAAPVYDWHIHFDFRTSAYAANWRVHGTNGNAPTGYVPGVGIQSGVSGWVVMLNSILQSSAPSTMQRIDIASTTAYPGSVAPPGGNAYQYSGGVNVSGSDQAPIAAGSGTSVFSAIGATGIQAGAYFNIQSTSYDHASPPPGTNDQNQVIVTIDLYGDGALPTVIAN